MLYFSENWSSLEVLITRSCNVAGLACVIKLDHGGGGWDASQDKTLYRVTVLRGSRNLPDNLCDAIRPGLQVSHLVINVSEVLCVTCIDSNRLVPQIQVKYFVVIVVYMIL